MALIADVHTDPNHAQVLEVGVGNVAAVAVPVTIADQPIRGDRPDLQLLRILAADGAAAHRWPVAADAHPAPGTGAVGVAAGITGFIMRNPPSQRDD